MAPFHYLCDKSETWAVKVDIHYHLPYHTIIYK